MRAAFRRCSHGAALAGLWLALSVSALLAQTSADRSSKPKSGLRTEVTFELLTEKNRTGLAAQEWGAVFQKLGASVRFASATSEEKPKTSETTVGGTRRVTVVGKLDRDGNLIFADRKLSRSESSKLENWIDELKTYGAQGAPQGKPAFGLNPTQFGNVYAALSQPLKSELYGQQPDAALAAMELPESNPLRFTADAANILKGRAGSAPIRNHVKGIAKGTALAAVLNQYGLGFRPLRTPSGAIDLTIDRLRDAEESWPIGWPPTEPNLKTAPKLFEFAEVDLEDQPLPDVLDAVSVATGVPIVLDYHNIEAKGIDVSDIKVSFPLKRTSWSYLLTNISVPNKLTRLLLIDEAGRAVVLFTTLAAKHSRG